MATWKKIMSRRDNGEMVEMQAPEIISASRSTDIPAFYSDWFFERLKRGYSAWTNPFNGVRSYISYANTRFIVFWSKNPRPLLAHLDELKERNIHCYVQYSLNDYEKQGIEKGVPPLTKRIDTFIELTEALGKGGVVWRFDPLMLTDKVGIDELLRKIEFVGSFIHDYTEKLVFSFADIAEYRKVSSNLTRNNIHYREWDTDSMLRMASEIQRLNSKWNLQLATCGERIDLGQFGIAHNHCIDDELIIRRAYNDRELMKFLKAELHPMPVPSIFGDSEPLPEDAIVLPNGMYATRGDNRDKGQRLFCGCMKSKDIGQYNTCVHLCEYCYANTSKKAALYNYEQHKLNPYGETITGI